MNTFRNVCFAVMLISFIGWCIYYYINEVVLKLLVNINYYTFTILEILMAFMGAFYMIINVIMLVGYLIYGLVFSYKKKDV